jgi:cob(I)alamin adenosyltransferase
MNESIKNLINLLEKTLDAENENILQDIEVDIKKIGVQLSKIYENDKNDEINLDDKDLDRIKFLIDEMSKKHKQQKEFLTEFSNFIKNRKIN